MANWAQNWVTFSGEEVKLNQVKALFKAMEIKGKETNEGQIPPFVKQPIQDYFFEIYADETDTVSYATKWSPNVEDLIVIANHFDLNFISTYEETASSIFGKAVFTSGNTEAKFYDLDNEDFDLYQFNEEGDIYTYEGENFESESEILETIFEKKFNQDY